MQTLEQQILGRFEPDRTISRAELELDANYDSVGRVLGELVKARKIVRVGRGQYRMASGGRCTAISTISDAIMRRIARSRRNVFLRSDFAELGSYDAVGRALRQVTRSGKLVQIGYGLYAKAAMSPFSGKPTPVVGIRKLATEALVRLGKSIDPSAAELAYNSGRSTQVPTGRTVVVKERVSRRIGYDGNYVVLQRA
jgi:hypothetical protein